VDSQALIDGLKKLFHNMTTYIKPMRWGTYCNVCHILPKVGNTASK
jgi:hypothetical protein